MAPNHYTSINTPNASIRYYIQRLLPGYLNYDPNFNPLNNYIKILKK